LKLLKQKRYEVDTGLETQLHDRERVRPGGPPAL